LPNPQGRTLSNTKYPMKLYSRAARPASLIRRLFLRSGLVLLLLSSGQLYGDIVVLTNGDRFTGKVRSLDDGKLTVGLSYADDPIVIDMSKVASVTTDKEMKASLEDGSTVSGILGPAAVAGSFLAANSSTPVEFKNVTSMVLLVPEPARPKTWKDRIATDSGLTYTFTGSSSYKTFNWNTATEYYGDKWEPWIDLQQTISGGGSSQSTHLSYGYLTTNYYLTGHLFIYPLLSGLRETIAGTGSGSSIQSGGGVGWAFHREKQYRLLIQGGPAAETDTATLYANNLQSQAGNLHVQRTIPIGVVGLNWNVRPDDGVQWKTQLLYVHSFDSDVRNRNRLGVNFVLSVPIAGPLSITFQAREFPNVLRPGLLSLKTFYLSTGFSISY
jgi:hypothetical protein